MAQVIKSEFNSDWKLGTIINSKKQIEYKKILFANNAQYLYLKWEYLAGLI